MELYDSVELEATKGKGILMPSCRHERIVLCHLLISIKQFMTWKFRQQVALAGRPSAIFQLSMRFLEMNQYFRLSPEIILINYCLG